MRDFVGQILAGYGDLPSYRAMMDIDGHAGPGEAMICGDEASVRQQLAALEAVGATEFAAAEIGGSSEDFARTRALLREVNAAG
jgi:5,10-methylenetetrahydromethanopterin reductase